MAPAVAAISLKGCNTWVAMSQLPTSIATNVTNPVNSSRVRNRSRVAFTSPSHFATSSTPIIGAAEVAVPLAYAVVVFVLLFACPLCCVTGAEMGNASTRTGSLPTLVVYQTACPARTARVVSAPIGRGVLMPLAERKRVRFCASRILTATPGS